MKSKVQLSKKQEQTPPKTHTQGIHHRWETTDKLRQDIELGPGIGGGKASFGIGACCVC